MTQAANSSTEVAPKVRETARENRLGLRLAMPALLAGALLWQTTLIRQAASVTYDETFYLSCSLQTVHDGWLDRRLSEGGAGALPVTISVLPVAYFFPRVNRPDPWQGTAEDPAIVAWSRWLNSLLVGVALVLTVYFWLLVRRGLWAATLGGGLMAFSPSIIAHASLATTDAVFALFGMFAVAAIGWRLKQPGWGTFWLTGISIGLALAAKISGVFLFPVTGLLLWLECWPQTTGFWWRRMVICCWKAAGRVALLMFVAFIVLWATDWFSFNGPLKSVPLSETSPDSLWIEILGNSPRARRFMDLAHAKLLRPSIVAAMISRYAHNRHGHGAFLMGQHSERGWWYYFPCVWVFKSTPPELLLSLAIIPLLWATASMQTAEANPSQLTRRAWLAAMGVFWALVCSANINIGQRHVLVLYPLTILTAVDLLWQVGERHRWLLAVATTLLLGTQIVSAAHIAPHYLAYFSPIIGGPNQGRYYLGDSNLDWGQDLPALRDQLKRLRYHSPLVAYFGTAKLAAYDITAETFEMVASEDLEKFDVFAMSVNRWNGLYMAHDALAEFRTLHPTTSAGYSILLYDLNEPGMRGLLKRALSRAKTSKAGAKFSDREQGAGN